MSLVFPNIEITNLLHGAGVNIRAPIRVATTTNGTLATAYQNGSIVDGITLVTGNRILLKDQSTATENGLYTVNATGVPSRVDDLGTGNSVNSVNFWIQEGTTNANTAWVCTSAPGSDVVGTNTLIFARYDVKDTLSVSRGGSGVTTFGGPNTLLYTTSADTISSITTGNNCVMVTDSSGVPVISSSIPANIILTTPQINDTSSNNQYIFAVNELTANRTVTLPPLTGNDEFVFGTHSQTLTNKTLTAPVISTISNTGTITLPTSTDTLVGRATTDTLTNKTLTAPIISTISNTGTITLPISTDTLVGRATTDTLTNKTLTTPIISTISNTGTLTLPTSTDTLVGRATTDTLTNKTLTAPVIDMGGNKITNLGAPILSTDATTKAYADSIASGLDTKDSVRVATTTDLNGLGDGYSYNSTGGLGRGQVTWTTGPTALDGVTLVNNNRILVKNNSRAEVTSVTTVADVSNSLDGKYFILYDTTGSVAFWIDVGNTGTTEPAHGATRSVEITTIETNDTANSVASKVSTVVNADAEFTTSVSTNVTTVTSVSQATLLDSTAETSGFTVSTTTQGSGGEDNGIWVRIDQNTWDRATDFDSDTEVTSGAYTWVEEGTTNSDSGWTLTTNNPITLGGTSGTALSFTQFSGAGQIIAGNGLDKSGNTLSVNLGASNITGTLAVSDGGTGLTTFGGLNTILYTTVADSLASITAGANGVLVTNGTNVPSISSTLPSNLSATNMTLTTPIVSTISNTGTITLPTSTDTLVGRATTDTLTNKTWGDNLNMNNFKITNLAEPTGDNDATTKDYADHVIDDLDSKESVRVASTVDLDSNSSISGIITYTETGGQSSRGQITATLVTSDTFTVDGITIVSANDGTRILLKDQTSGAQNGIWTTTVNGTSLTLDRAVDFDKDVVTARAYMWVEEGTTNSNSGWLLTTNDPITLGGTSGTALSFTQFSGAGQITAGSGLDKSGNTLSLSTTLPSGTSATNMTLTTPKIITAINDTNGNELIAVTATASAINEFTIANATTGAGPTMSVTGGDTNVDLNLQVKGTGVYRLLSTSTTAAELRLFEDTDDGSNYVGLKAGTLVSNLTFTLPVADGSNGDTLMTNGAGVLSFTTPPTMKIAYQIAIQQIDVNTTTYTTVGYMSWKNSRYSSYSNGALIYEVDITDRNLDIRIRNTTAGATVVEETGVSSGGFKTVSVFTNPNADGRLELQVRKSATGGTNPQIYGVQLEWEQ